MIFLTVIIPVYNSELYLKKCIESVLTQNINEEELEIIVIDDGSTDGSLSIIKEFSLKIKNFKTIIQSNKGVGFSRNKGLEVASGKYVLFLDSDDWLLDDGMRILKEEYIIPNNYPDIITFHSRTVDKYYKAKEWNHIVPHNIIFQGNLLNYAKKIGIGKSVWNNLFKKEFLINNNLRFSEHKIAEDMLFMLRLFNFKDNTIVSSNLNIYRYRVNKKGALNSISTNHIRQVFLDLIDIVIFLEKFKFNSFIPLNILNEDINICKRWAFTRLCSGGFKYSEIIAFINYAKNKNIFPISQTNSIDKAINLILKSSFITYIFSSFYRNIFIPFFKPFIKRN